MNNQPLNILPQNIKTLTGEIGEKQVLLRLLLLAHNTAWYVFQNLGESGFDILLLHSKTGEKIRIEVQTCQKLYTMEKKPEQVEFELGDEEYQSCDYLIGYLLVANDFYMVHKQVLKRAQTDGKTRWKFVVPLTEAGEPDPQFQAYRNAWNNLHQDFAAHAAAEAKEKPCTKIIQEVEDAAPGLYWPEFEEAVLQREAERLQSLVQMEANRFVQNTEAEMEKLYQEQKIQAELGYCVELELDRSYTPKCFQVECRQPGHFLKAEPELEDLKTKLVEAYKLGKFRDQDRKARPGWVLRTETGERY
jgi:hypothetical protein